MVLLGFGAVVVCGLAWYVHWRGMTRIDGAHLLYLPVVLACLWFGWRGLAVALLGGGCLVLTHFTGAAPDTSLEHDSAICVTPVAAYGVGWNRSPTPGHAGE